MELNQLQAFLLVSQTKHFTKASEFLYISQTTVTARIKQLEKSLGKQLFRRDNRNVEITKAGEILLPYAYRICELVEEGIEKTEASERYDEYVVIASTSSMWEYILYSIIKDFNIYYPRIKFRLRTGHSSEIINKMLDGIIDIALTYNEPQDKDRIVVIPYIKEKMYLVGASFYKQTKEMYPKSLINQPYIHMDWGRAFNEWYEKTVKHFSTLHIDNHTLFIKYLLKGDGIGFLPETVAKPFFKSGDLVEIKFNSNPKVPDRTVFLIYSKKSKVTIENLLNHLLERREGIFS